MGNFKLVNYLIELEYVFTRPCFIHLSGHWIDTIVLVTVYICKLFHKLMLFLYGINAQRGMCRTTFPDMIRMVIKPFTKVLQRFNIVSLPSTTTLEHVNMKGTKTLFSNIFESRKQNTSRRIKKTNQE